MEAEKERGRERENINAQIKTLLLFIITLFCSIVISSQDDIFFWTLTFQPRLHLVALLWFSFSYSLFSPTVVVGFRFFFFCVCRVYARLLFNSQPILYAGIIVLNSLHAAVAHTDVATVQQQNWLKEAMQYVTFSIILF